MFFRTSFFRIGLIVAGIFLPLSALHSQESDAELISAILEETNANYEVDQRLANGKYAIEEYRGAEGDPYYVVDAFYPGDLVYKGVEFKSVPIKYDIYEQRLVIQHKSEDFQVITHLTNEHITSFTIYGEKFRRMNLTGSTTTFYKVVKGDGNIQCYFFESKIREEQTNMAGKLGYLFKEMKPRMFLRIHGEVSRFSSTRSFIKAMPDQIQDDLKHYLKSNRIKINRISQKQFPDILNYCEALYTEAKGGES